MSRDQLARNITELTPESFDAVALEVFRYQADRNQIYARYLKLLRVEAGDVLHRTDIPHLPISLLKGYLIQSGDWEPVLTFTSSGTTAATASRHALRDKQWYRLLARQTFEQRYGALSGRAVLALLPAYLERSGSSLVFMADDFIKRSGHPASGFYLDDLQALSTALAKLVKNNTPTLLIGVSFALMDLADRFAQPLGNTLVMETGGMKGRRREITRRELHRHLRDAFQVAAIHSEYGMTELLSQAYAPLDGLFYPAATLRVGARDITDPFCLLPTGRTGALNLTDLANLDTISFLASDDLGRLHEDGSFEVLGRMDNTDIRGCNLLVGEA